MTIPNVFMYWCQHKAKCKWCEQTIEAGTPVIQVYFWNKGNEDKRTWNIKRFYHPQCYIEQGMDYLKMNPFVPYQRSTKSKGIAKLNNGQRELRYKLLKRKASIDQRKRRLNGDYPDRVWEEAKLDLQISELMVEIASVGGIPKKWLE